MATPEPSGKPMSLSAVPAHLALPMPPKNATIAIAETATALAAE
jgi:hypothetical protein